jgi:4-diphosphocytidyl-2-C-methyl-D-erythritol kinase
LVGSPPVRARCPAKLNLFLEVLAKRPDGYHEIDTVMVEAPGPGDGLEAEETAGPGATLEVAHAPGWSGEPVPSDDRNLALRAARLVLEEARSPRGVRLRLLKSIPAGAGLGGGSSDAAAALRAVNRLLGDPVAPARLAELALALGSDVPYFLAGGAARARGRGERVESLDLALPPPFRFSLFEPHLRVSTAEVYARCRPAPAGERRDPAAVLAALRSGDATALAAACFNRLEEPAREVCPDLGRALDAVRARGLGPVHLSGSGASFFVVRVPGGPGDAAFRRALDDLPGGGSITIG